MRQGSGPHHKAAGLFVLAAQVIGAPVPHSHQDGHQAFSRLRQGIFHFGRNYRENLPVDQLLGFQLPQLLGQHFGGGADDFPQLGKTELFLRQMPKDQGLVLSADEVQSGLHRAVIFFFHGKTPIVSKRIVWYKIVHTCVF